MTVGGVTRRYYKWVVLVTCMLVYVSSTLTRWNYSGIAGYLTSEWGLGKPELGLLGAVFFYSYALGQAPWGSITDLLGARRVVPIGVGIGGILLIAFAFAHSFTHALVLRGALGLLGASSFVPCLALLAKWFKKQERGLTNNIFSGLGGGLGEASTFLLVPLIALFLAGGRSFFGLAGWRGSTAIIGIIILGIAVLSAILLRDDPSEVGLPSVQAAEDGKKVQGASYWSVAKDGLKDPAFWMLTLAWQGFVVSLRLLPAWLPLFAARYYMQTHGMTSVSAMVAGGALATAYTLGRGFGAPVVGKLSDVLLERYGISRTWVLLGAHILILANAYLFTTPLRSAVLLGLIAFISGSMINIFPLISAAAAEIWSIRTCGLMVGLINMVGQLLGATALSVSGYMAVRYSIKGGAYYTEYRGIWYTQMLFTCIAILGAVYVIFRERRAARAGGGYGSGGGSVAGVRPSLGADADSPRPGTARDKGVSTTGSAARN